MDDKWTSGNIDPNGRMGFFMNFHFRTSSYILSYLSNFCIYFISMILTRTLPMKLSLKYHKDV